ncbi:MAG: MFS transporter [bacterium]
MRKIAYKNIYLGLLCLEAFAVIMNVAAMSGLVPAIATTFHISNFTAGKIIVVYMIPYGISALFYGYIGDRVSKKAVKVTCSLAFVIFSILCGLAISFKAIIIFRGLSGVVAASTIPISLTLIGDMFPKEERGRAVGIFLSTTYFSTVSGVFLSGILNWRWMFLLPALVGLVAWGLIFFFLPDSEITYKGERETYWKILFSKEGIMVYCYIILTSFMMNGIYSWLGVFLYQEHQMGQFQISTLLTLTGIGSVFGGLIGGILSDKWGKVTMVISGSFLTAAAVHIFTSQILFISIAVALLIYGIGRTINHGSLVTMLTDFPTESRSKAVSLNSFIRFISGGMGTIITGVFVREDFQSTFTIYAIILILCSAVAYPILTPKRMLMLK